MPALFTITKRGNIPIICHEVEVPAVVNYMLKNTTGKLHPVGTIITVERTS